MEIKVDGVLDVFKRHGIKEEQFLGMSLIPHYYDEHIYKASTARLRKLQTWTAAYKNQEEEVSNALMRFVLYMYDEGSPMMSLFQDLAKRMAICFELSNLTSKAHRGEILKGRLTVVIDMTFELLKNQNNMLWNLIITNEAMFYENMRVVMDDVIAEKDKDLVSALKIKHDLAVSMDKTHGRLTKYLNQFYRNDKTMVEKHSVISSRINSESVAEMMSR